ncbi:MAG: transcription elongation factor GreA [Phycisphaerales bacterium]
MSDAEPNEPPPPLPNAGESADATPSATQPTRAKRDKWAHRRAEPRTLAFLWAMYILLAGLLTIGVLLVRGPWALLDKTVYQYAARMMLVCVGIGLAILWPMVRLSQSVSLRERPASVIFKDMLVLLPPVQAVIWAQAAARAGWAFDLIGAIALSFIAWPMLAGAALAVLLRPRPGQYPGQTYDAGTVFAGALGPGSTARTLAMSLFVVAALGPLIALRTGPAWAAMLSPVSAVLDLSRSRGVGPGVSSMTDGRWEALLVQAALAGVAWLVLIALAITRNRPNLAQTPAGGPPQAGPIASPSTPRGPGPEPHARGDRLSGPTSEPGETNSRHARTQEGRPMDYMTAEERVKIKARLDELIANRPKITERIAEARALGDLKENAEYHSARELQGMEEAEIRRLEDRLENAKIVDDGLAKDAQVAFLGSMVKIQEVTEKGPVGEAEMVKLVGEFSDDPPDDYDEVTANSPMGTALMKARVGETVRVDAPRGTKRFEIVEIS